MSYRGFFILLYIEQIIILYNEIKGYKVKNEGSIISCNDGCLPKFIWANNFEYYSVYIFKQYKSM